MSILNPDFFWKELIKEDAPFGDKTSDALNLPAYERSAKILAKSDLSLSGANQFFEIISSKIGIQITPFFKDGDRVLSTQCIALLEGNWKDLLLIERPLLNWMGHLSGIASLAWEFKEQVKHTECKILDTRKTTPLFRSFEKKAVLDGGAFNHRANLSDAMMLKENHLSLYDFDIKRAIKDCLQKNPDLHLTVEASSMGHVSTIAQTEAHQIMLDNFNNREIQDAIEMIKKINKKIKIEASGNMNLSRVKSVAELGVDFISVGAITHSAPQADLTMLMDF